MKDRENAFGVNTEKKLAYCWCLALHQSNQVQKKDHHPSSPRTDKEEVVQDVGSTETQKRAQLKKTTTHALKVVDISNWIRLNYQIWCCFWKHETKVFFFRSWATYRKNLILVLLQILYVPLTSKIRLLNARKIGYKKSTEKPKLLKMQMLMPSVT